jgi:hypothetical protein
MKINTHNAEVGGSSPPITTIFLEGFGQFYVLRIHINFFRKSTVSPSTSTPSPFP